MLDTIKLPLVGLTNEYREFNSLYGSAIRSLWNKQFAQEDRRGRSIKRYTITQYFITFFLVYLIKHEYKLNPLADSLPSDYNIDVVREKLLKLNIDLGELLTKFNIPQKLFSLEVNEDNEIVETSRGRTVTYTDSDFIIGEENGMKTITSSGGDNDIIITDYMDELSFSDIGSFQPFSVVMINKENFQSTLDKIRLLKCTTGGLFTDNIEYEIANLAYTGAPPYYNVSAFQLSLFDTSNNSIDKWVSTYPTDNTWRINIANVGSTTNASKLYSCRNGVLDGIDETPFIVSFRSPETTDQIKITIYENQVLHKCEIYKDMFDEKSMIEIYTYYKNLLNI